jgi:hypothetical protein
MRGAMQLGVQVKRMALPVHMRAADWKRMHAEGTRLGWRWVVAAVDPGGAVTYLDPARAKGSTLSAKTAIANLLLWLDAPPKRRKR